VGSAARSWEIGAAHEYLESNRSCGKVVLDFSV
jgi:hypothetical protein